MIDPRGTRFSAAITTIVLAVVILTTPGPIATVLISLQTLAFAFGAILGPGAQPYGWVFKKLVRPRLAAPKHMEDPLPPQFAQAVGLFFGLSASVSMLLGWTLGVWIFAGFALFAAALNAVFGFCLGCEIYVRIRKFIPAPAMPEPTTAPVLDLTDWNAADRNAADRNAADRNVTDRNVTDRNVTDRNVRV